MTKTNRDIVADYDRQIKNFDTQIDDLRKVYSVMRKDETVQDETLREIGCHISALEESRRRADKWRKAYTELPADAPDGFPCPF